LLEDSPFANTGSAKSYRFAFYFNYLGFTEKCGFLESGETLRCRLGKPPLIGKATIARDHIRRHAGDSLDLAISATRLAELFASGRAEPVEDKALVPDPACRGALHDVCPDATEALWGVRLAFPVHRVWRAAPAPHPSTRGKEAPKPIEVGFYKFKKLSA